MTNPTYGKTHPFPIIRPYDQTLPCPYEGVFYKDVPGYGEGCGCPVCKGISSRHVRVRPDVYDNLGLNYRRIGGWV